ncbi:MAG: hypothetical protein H6662_10625 [Ardenticatenaceae bacterium]|nr:hypothetical protein [Anaerolineales bacterium]MCB8922029.1 hypothetical protein [Ardenticatenaceae bacterium]MCB8989605.1 hypothetical protein [Ardenticatenaceae bacterium]MCB9003148.1 hypothetical protein [Ardenticatenaceae bacterium]
MTPFSQWQALKQHPVYVREKGGLGGKPNPYYDLLRRYSPLAIMGVIVLGICGASSNPALYAGDEDLMIVWCLMCLPGMALSALTLFGMLMVPALIAPSISLERTQGTWDILRMTPLSQRQLVLAKMLGALARLRLLWWMLFVVSLFQGMIMACSMTLASPAYALWGWLLGLGTVVRPWLEIIFAALVGMWSSLGLRSAMMALVISYTAVLLLKLLNNSAVWALIFNALHRTDMILLTSTLLPTAVYTLAILITAAALFVKLEDRV